MTDSFWTPGRTQRTARQWRDGVSATEIAAAVGCTRNAVIGKMRRIGVVSGSGLDRAADEPYRAVCIPPIQSSDGRAEGRALKGPTGDLREDSHDTGSLDDRNERGEGSVTPQIEAGQVRKPAPSISHGREATRTEDLGRVVAEPVLKPGPSETIAKVDKRAFRYEWAPERNEMLRRLVADGVPIRRIAFEMKITRVTVRTKMKLLGLVRHSPLAVAAPKTVAAVHNPILDPQRRRRRNTAFMPKALPSQADPVDPAPETSQPIAESAAVTFFDLTKCMCRWPLPHAADDEALYCGARCEFRASYCDFHCDASTNPKYRRPRGVSGERLPLGRSVTASVLRSV